MTSVKRRLADRRARNRALAAQDAALKCAFCKRRPVNWYWAPFCSGGCQGDAVERAAVLAQGKR